MLTAVILSFALMCNMVHFESSHMSHSCDFVDLFFFWRLIHHFKAFRNNLKAIHEYAFIWQSLIFITDFGFELRIPSKSFSRLKGYLLGSKIP